MNSATVFNIQRFSLHDGPGIRTTVFLKGCPLSCPWCHNPESRDSRPQLAIQADRCLDCGACLSVCPQDLAGPLDELTGANRPDATCLHCGACAEACPSVARDLVGETMDVTQAIARIERDRAYFEESGGGVTFSGGEPLANGNAAFLLDLLKECGKRGIHRTVDTCGHVDTANLLEAANYTDLFLYDLKLMDDQRHRVAVGVGNERILDNLRALAPAARRIWIRVPLIPGLTDDEDNLNAVAEFVAGLPVPAPVHLLPFHAIGRDKFGRLGMDYFLGDLAPAQPEEVNRQADLIRSHGLEVHIGG